MAWAITNRSQAPWIEDAKIVPEEVLYDYDGPTIFSTTFGFFLSIFLKVDEFDSTDLFLAVSTTDDVLKAVRSGFLSVRGAFTADQYWIVEARKNLAVVRYWACRKEELPSEFLPQKNLTLFAHLGRAPDTMLQASSFFSIAFEGERMRRSGMPFSQFKFLVDVAHDASRKVLTPFYLVRTRTSTYDYSIQEPSFSSLILSINRPIINERKIMHRIPNEYNTTGDNSIQQDFLDQRNLFLEEMREVVKEAETGDVSDAVVSERYFILEAVLALLPSSDNYLTSVDFTGGGASSVASVGLVSKTGDNIRTAFHRADGLTREIEGKIEITNAPSNYFVLLTAGMRQINCAVEPEIYRKLEKNPLFRNGSHIRVRGDLYRRPRRDWLRVKGVPQLE